MLGAVRGYNTHIFRVNGELEARVEQGESAPHPRGSLFMTAVKARFALPHGGTLCISQGNIVSFQGDAIVNAADHKCIYGKGVDGAINKAGGPVLLAARRALPIVDGTKETRCPVGEARCTRAGALQVKHVIHAVGPNFNPRAHWVQKVAPNGETLLYNAYLASMRLAKEHACGSIAFSLLSAGFFKGPKTAQDIYGIACRAIRDGAYDGLREAHLLAFGEPRAVDTHDVTVLVRAASTIGLSRAATSGGSSTTASGLAASSSIAACFGRPATSGGGGGDGGGLLTAAQRELVARKKADALARQQQGGGAASGAAASSSSCSASAAAPVPAPGNAPSPAPAQAINLVSDGDTEEDDVYEVPPPGAKRTRAE